ncbi:uncharacterized protein BDR25DRAFT_227946, partial [Lindgomyces ingoldianus]
TKGGQLGFMYSMAISLGTLDTRVNLIVSGRTKGAHESKECDENGTNWEGQVSRKDIEDHPAIQAGRPNNTTDAALYLIKAGFVTGRDIIVNGGTLRKKTEVSKASFT